MHTIHIITSTNVGGAQIMLRRYLAASDQGPWRHSVVSVLPEGSLAGQIRDMGVPVHSLGLTSAAGTAGALRRLRNYLRREGPDVIHGWMYHGCLASWAGRVGRRDRPALVWGIHHSLHDPRNEKPATRGMLRAMAALSRGVDLVTYCSNASRRQHEAIGFSGDRSVLIPNGVDIDLFRPDPNARPRLAALCDVPQERILVGNVARAHPMKDHHAMVRAVAQLVGQGRDVQAVIVGEGHEGGAAAQEASRLGISDRLSLLSVRDDIHRLVPGLDVFLLSSAWGEAFPLSVAEAMSAGVACVVTDVGDCADLVGPAGLVVPPGDSEAQARAVERLIAAGPDGRAELGAQARDRVRARFSMPRYVTLQNEAYEWARAPDRPPGSIPAHAAPGE